MPPRPVHLLGGRPAQDGLAVGVVGDGEGDELPRAAVGAVARIRQLPVGGDADGQLVRLGVAQALREHAVQCDGLQTERLVPGVALLLDGAGALFRLVVRVRRAPVVQPVAASADGGENTQNCHGLSDDVPHGEPPDRDVG